MKAIRLTAAGQPLELVDVPVPEPGPDEVLVRVAGCGVCHTDIGFWKDGVPTKHALPLTLGHEISGTVVGAPAHAHRDLLHREVIVPAVIPCGDCPLCAAGRGNACRRQLMPGNDMDGGFAEFVRVPARGLCVVRRSRRPRPGGALGRRRRRHHALPGDRAQRARGRRPRRSSSASGGVGAHCVQIAAALGARVVALDIDPARLAMVAPHGAGLTVDLKAADFKTRAPPGDASRRARGDAPSTAGRSSSAPAAPAGRRPRTAC